jgi:hypothetical protein
MVFGKSTVCPVFFFAPARFFVGQIKPAHVSIICLTNNRIYKSTQIEKWSLFNVSLSSGRKKSLFFATKNTLKTVCEGKKTVTVLSFFVCR